MELSSNSCSLNSFEELSFWYTKEIFAFIMHFGFE